MSLPLECRGRERAMAGGHKVAPLVSEHEARCRVAVEESPRERANVALRWTADRSVPEWGAAAGAAAG